MDTEVIDIECVGDCLYWAGYGDCTYPGRDYCRPGGRVATRKSPPPRTCPWRKQSQFIRLSPKLRGK